MDDWNDVLVVDADGHVYEGDVDLRSRMPEKWRSQAPVRLKDNQGNSRILLEGRIWSASQGPGPGVSGPMTDKARKSRPGMTDPAARLKDMDLEGIDVAVLFGTQIALTVNGLMSGELAAVLCRAVNEWLLEYCSADRERLKAVGLIPCQAPQAAVRELEYLARAGAVAAMLPTNVYGRNMGDPMFDPIYDCAQSLGMPLCVHPQTGHDGVPGVSGVMGAGSERFFKYVYVHMTAFPFELMIAMMHMIGEGVFDRFAKLRVGFMEGGAGWLPYWAERFDEHLERLAPQMPDLKRRPSEIIASEQIVVTCESEESGLDRVLAANGEQTVLYASDYCHWDCRFPDSVRDIVECGDLSFARKKRLLGQNAVRFFKLTDLPAPAALSAARRGWIGKAAVGAAVA
ncbi:MAG TPA: amidohydrolase family protein [candidate division Zixibacteria bacterium]|nr:amidohydrolase family protein [candidate division Zixibacteria bacterium]